MNRTVKFLAVSATFGAVFCGLLPLSVSGQETTTTVETRGFGGVKEANVFAPKYKERIQTYSEQISMGSTKGWLTPAEVEQFTARLNEMRKMEADAAAKGWVKSDIDAVEKVFQKFNIDLTAAANKPAASAKPETAPAETSPEAKPAAQPVSTKSSGATSASSKKKSSSGSKAGKSSTKAPAKKTK